VTTFRTSRGTIVNVEAPEIVIPPGLVPEDLNRPWQSGGAGREALREEFDVHSVHTWEKFLREGVDAHFNARIVDLNGNESVATPSDYWVQQRYAYPLTGQLTCPASLRAVAIYSKRAFNYPVLVAEGTPPDLAGYPANSQFYVGLENGAGGGTGIAAFRFRTPDGVSNVVEAIIGSQVAWRTVDITTLLPPDYLTTRRKYGVYLSRTCVKFTLDYVEKENVLAYGLLTDGSYFTPISGPPYALFSFEGSFSRSLCTLMEVIGRGMELSADFSPAYLRVSDGDPQPPRVFELYVTGTNTKFAEYSLASGTLISHPVPVYGYESATIKFRANQATGAGGLIVEELLQTGNWRTYDARTYGANDYFVYPLGGDCVLIRLSYTPDTYPATIEYGEVVLR